MGIITGLNGKISQSGGLKVIKGGTRKLRFPILQKGWVVETTWAPFEKRGLQADTFRGGSRLVDITIQVAPVEGRDATYRYVTLWGGMERAEREALLSEWLLSYTIRTIAHISHQNPEEGEMRQLFQTELAGPLEELGLALESFELFVHPLRGAQGSSTDGEFSYNNFDIS